MPQVVQGFGGLGPPRALPRQCANAFCSHRCRRDTVIETILGSGRDNLSVIATRRCRALHAPSSWHCAAAWYLTSNLRPIRCRPCIHPRRAAEERHSHLVLTGKLHCAPHPLQPKWRKSLTPIMPVIPSCKQGSAGIVHRSLLEAFPDMPHLGGLRGLSWGLRSAILRPTCADPSPLRSTLNTYLCHCPTIHCTKLRPIPVASSPDTWSCQTFDSGASLIPKDLSLQRCSIDHAAHGFITDNYYP